MSQLTRQLHQNWLLDLRPAAGLLVVPRRATASDVLRTRRAFQGPLGCVSQLTLDNPSQKATIEGDWSSLLSIRYGKPNTMSMLKPAMSIIGFLSSDSGETRFGISSSEQNPHRGNYLRASLFSFSGPIEKLTASPLHIIALHRLRPRLDDIPGGDSQGLAFIVPGIPPEGAPGGNGPVAGDVDAQRRKGVRRAMDGKEVAASGNVSIGKRVCATKGRRVVV